MQAVVAQTILDSLVGMGHSARLDDGQGAIAFAAAAHDLEHEPGINQRGDAHLALFEVAVTRGQAGEERRRPAHFQEINETGHHRLDLGRVPDTDQIGDRVHDHDIGLELVDRLVHRHEMHLQPMRRRP